MLKEQLWAEAMRHGLGRANEVLIVAEGAVWIWNLAGDRFPGARQRVDLWHVSQHLWAVAHTLHPDGEAAARAWVEPLLSKLKEDASCEVITELEQLRERLEGSKREQVDKEINQLPAKPSRADGLGSGAKEGRAAGQWGRGIDLSPVSSALQTHGPVLEPRGRRSFNVPGNLSAQRPLGRALPTRKRN